MKPLPRILWLEYTSSKTSAEDVFFDHFSLISLYLPVLRDDDYEKRRYSELPDLYEIFLISDGCSPVLHRSKYYQDGKPKYGGIKDGSLWDPSVPLFFVNDYKDYIICIDATHNPQHRFNDFEINYSVGIDNSPNKVEDYDKVDTISSVKIPLDCIIDGGTVNFMTNENIN